jgi:hypothetical protein
MKRPIVVVQCGDAAIALPREKAAKLIRHFRNTGGVLFTKTDVGYIGR